MPPASSAEGLKARIQATSGLESKETSLNCRFTKSDRLLKRAQFVHLANQAKKVGSHLFIAFFEPSPHASSRIGITVSRRVGNAATRNRLKRLAREYFRQNRRTLEHPWDIHVIAKRKAAGSGYQAVFGSLEKIFKRIEASIEPPKAD